MGSRLRSALTALVVTLMPIALVAACSSDGPEAASCADEPVDTFKEMLIVDDEVVNDPRSLNHTNGAWSFRHAIENMAPEGAAPGAFAGAWLESWVARKELNGFPIDSPTDTRAGAMQDRVVCPWLKRTPANACNEDCSACASRQFDLSTAPFRLLGIVNRMDQRQFFADAPSGEGRLMFGVTDGAADDPASKPLAMVTIFEYVLPETRSLNEWAASWHALAKLDGQGEQYRAALQAITDGFVTRNARPGRQNGSALAQVRTNEAALSWIWQLREFGLATDGSLTLRPVWNTPAEQLNNSQTLARFVNENAELIRAKKHVLPAAMRPGASDALRFSWAMPGVDAETTRAFTEGTCNGCHQTHSVVDSAFHISPFRSGRAKVSRFLYDPDHAGNDEVHTRAASFREALGPSCGARP